MESSTSLQFRGQTPECLKFGTSGLRGKVDAMTDLEVYINTTGFLEYLLGMHAIQAGDPVCLGGDLRPSTDGDKRSILRAVAKAVEDLGLVIRFLGRLPTPALMFDALQANCASIMVTGSHIPFDRNGIKFNKPNGEVLKADESPILSSVHATRQLQYAMPAERSLFDDHGWFKDSSSKTWPASAHLEATERYLDRYRGFFPAGSLEGMECLVYQHSAVGRDLLAKLLESLGAKVWKVGKSERFVPIDTEDISAEQLNELQRMLEEVIAQGGKPTALVSTDGDSDRPLVCGVDSWGRLQFIPGDLLGCLSADFLKAQTVVVPISANDAVDQHLARKEIHPYKTKIGSPHVIATMQALKESGQDAIVGWEANGGFLLSSPVEGEHGALQPLETRDAFLPILCVLRACQVSSKQVVDLMGELPARFGKAGLIDAFPQAASRSLIQRWTPPLDQLVDWRWHKRTITLHFAHGDHREADHDEALLIAHLCEEAARFFTPEAGYGTITRINYMDGVRFYFDSGDIAHIRPSGNAPQLRFYAVANSQQRAEQMVRDALAEPSGLLRSMELES